MNLIRICFTLFLSNHLEAKVFVQQRGAYACHTYSYPGGDEFSVLFALLSVIIFSLNIPYGNGE